MSDKTLYPADRVPPEEPKSDKAALRDTLKARIRALVPDKGVAMTYDDITTAVRAREEDGFYVFWPEEVHAAINEVKAERPPESQLKYKSVVAEEPLDLGADEKPKEKDEK